MQLPIIDEYNATRNLATKPFHAACYAPWTSMVFDSIGRVRACCTNFEYPLGNIAKQRLDEIWEGVRYNRLRQALKDYDLQFGCRYCERKLEAGAFHEGYIDAATLIISKFERLDVESEAPFWPKHLEFHLSNRCNLECVMCTGEFSSGIRRKREKLPPLSIAYNDQFFEDLEKYLPHLQTSQYLGGEPFIIPEMYRVWNMLIDQKLTPQCHVTTNGTVWGPKIERILDSLPVSVSVSMDGVTKETFEKIRINAKFERVCENMRRFRDFLAARKMTTAINFTMSRMNWKEFPDMLLFAEDEGVKINVLDLNFPENMSLYTLPSHLLSGVINQLELASKRIASRLTINASILETKIFELRHRLKGTISSEGLSEFSDAVVPDDLHHELQERLQIITIENSIEQESAIEPNVPVESHRHEEEAAVDTDIDQLVASIESLPPQPTNYYSWQIFREITPPPTLEDAEAKIRSWASESHLECIHCNQSDEVIELVSPTDSLLHEVSEVVGSTLPNLVWILADLLGKDFAIVELNDDPSDFYRTVRFQSPERGSTLVRSQFVPRYNENLELVGTSLLIGYRPETASAAN